MRQLRFGRVGENCESGRAGRNGKTGGYFGAGCYADRNAIGLDQLTGSMTNGYRSVKLIT